MATLAEKALAIVLGIETVAGKGPTGRAGRAALRAGAKAIIAGTPIVARGAATTARVAAPAALTLARQNPYTAAALGGLALQQAGAFDPVTNAIEAEVQRRTAQVMAPIEAIQRPTVQTEIKRTVKRRATKYQQAVKAGMSAVKNSKFNGPKGKIKNAKSAFKSVNLVASAANKGKKLAKTGVKGVIAKAVKRFF